jgi:hypothetical protein
MQAMLLFRRPPAAVGANADMGAWMAYMDALRAAGVMRGGERLGPPETATTLRLAAGRRLVQDGPFADTKEVLGGFVVIKVADMATALDWAARCPAAQDGAVEVRPVLPPPGAA